MSLFLTPKKHSRERVYEMECPTGSPTGVSAIDDLEGDCPSGLSDSMNTISSINSLSISFSPIRLFRTPTVAVGSHWSIEVHILKNSSAADEVTRFLFSGFFLFYFYFFFFRCFQLFQGSRNCYMGWIIKTNFPFIFEILMMSFMF